MEISVIKIVQRIITFLESFTRNTYIVKELAEAATKSTDDLIMHTRKSLDDMADSARKSYEDLSTTASNK
uniref:Uncharacterized protein n=1 Tax=Megaselia scalaris TaxID=36166 RepID=T1GHL8_MEGSC